MDLSKKAFLRILAGVVLAVGGLLYAADIPAPRDVLGFLPGDDFKLADWTQITGYLDRLDEASDRVKVLDLGKTTLGRRFVLAVVTSPDNMGRLDEIRAVQKRLHDPRGLAPGEKEDLLSRGRAVVFISCSIHSTEIAGSQMSMELLWRLASDNTPEVRKILDETVLLLVPSVNPDGIDMVTDWYRKNLGTPYEAAGLPWLYHAYTGHDNNRDYFMLTQKETQLMTRVLYHDWFPLLVYDIHQMGSNGPRLFIPPYQDPINPNLDPLLLRELYVLVGNAAVDLTRAGKTGVATNTIFDAWYNMANRASPLRHNVMSVLSEAASAMVASPIFLRSSEIRVRGGGNEVQSTNLEPWPGGWWRLRDIVEYEETVALSFLRTIAGDRMKYLANYSQFAERQVAKGRSEPPFAFLIPRGQKDLPTALKLVDVLRGGGAEVFEAQSDFTADEIPYPAGTYIIPLAQPYRAFIKDLLERKSYPLPAGLDAAQHLPYDEASWTLPLQMGVRTVAVTNSFEAAMRLLEASPFPVSEIEGTGGKAFILANTANNDLVLVNRLHKAGLRMACAAEAFKAGGRSFGPGAVVIDGAGVDRSRLGGLAKGLGVRIFAADVAPAVKLVPLRRPRIGLYQPWTSSMDEGWLRWVLEQFEFPFKVLHNEEIRAGELDSNLTHIILPGLSAESILMGRRQGDVPPRYAGGIGKEGAAALYAFVRKGGVLIALESAADFAIEQFGLPAKNIIEPPRRFYDETPGKEPAKEGKEKIYSPGSLLRVRVNNGVPAGYGYGEEATVFSYFSPVFAVEKGTVIASFPEADPLESGILLNGEKLRGKAAAVECDSGRGRVLLLGFDAVHRAQAHGTFKFIFNALLF